MYYHGDYYQGDYYQGDPFIGALLGAGVTWLGKKLLGRSAATAGKTAIARVGAGAATGIVGGAGAVAGAGILSWAARRAKDVFLSIGEQGLPPGFPRGMPSTPGAGACCPTGFHFNKQMSTGRKTMGAPAGSFCVRNRSINVANPRALRRSLRRVAGFGKLAMRAKKDVRRAAKSLGA